MILHPLTAQSKHRTERAEASVPVTEKLRVRATKARSGGGVRPGFEGGQMPLSRRLPKRGFSNYPFKVVYETVNVGVLNEFEDGTVVTAEELYAKNMISGTAVAVKILGDGEIEKKLTVKAAKFSESAKAKIEAAGGKAEVL